MKEHLLVGFLALAFIWSLLFSNIQAQRDVDPCHLFPNGTKLRHPDDCSREILCLNFKSVAGTKCTGSKPFYNKDTHKCETHLTDHSTCEIDCTNMTEKFVEDPKSCYGYYYCQDEELALHGHCPENFHFSQIQQYCVYNYNSTCSINKLNFCAIVKTGVKFKDESHCGNYNECVVDKKTKNVTLQNKYCETNRLFYNPAKGECVAEAIEGCRPVPADACGTVKKIRKNEFISDGATCRGSFYCADVGKEPDPNPKWYQCPDNKFFSVDKQKCMDPLEVVCRSDRCEGSKRSFVVSSERGCRQYLICNNGVNVADGNCGNYFFDEVHGICTQEIMTYPACYYKA